MANSKALRSFRKWKVSVLKSFNVSKTKSPSSLPVNLNLLALLIAYIGGIVASRSLLLPFWLMMLCFGVSFTATGLFLLLIRRPAKIPVYVCLFLLLFFLGGLRSSLVGSKAVAHMGRVRTATKSERLVEGAREYIQGSVYRFLPVDQASLMMGILLGDTAEISDRIKDDFQRTGLTHILAVSGMNVGILVIVSLFLLKFLPAGQSLRFPAVSTLVVYYAALSRFQPSVLRASLMALVGLGAYVLGRQHNLLNSLSTAALALLLYDPLFLYSISFQLSFAATLAIIILMPILEDVLFFLPKMIKGMVSVCLAAQLGVAPLLVYHFGQFSAISLLANLLVVPATYPVLILGMILAPVSAVSIGLVRILSWLAGGFLSYIIVTSRLLSSFPLAAFSLSSPPLFLIVIYYLALTLLFLRLQGRKTKASLALLFIGILSFVTVFMGCEVGKGGPPSKLTVTFIDVGQGDATLIQTPEGQTVLVDGGPPGSAFSSFLNSQGVGKVDFLILSHPHADHVGGLASVVLNRRVNLVLDGGQPHTARLYRDFLKAVEKRGVAYRLARSGATFEVGPKLKIEVLAPESTFLTGDTANLNNSSVVVKMTYGKFSLLFPGDIERARERQLIRLGVDFKATVLKVPHHGSSNGSDPAFLKAVHPEVAVISVGENEFGHPAQSTLNKLRSLGAEVYRTDRSGNVTILSDGTTFEVRTVR